MRAVHLVLKCFKKRLVTFFEHSSAFDLDKYEKKLSRLFFPFGSSFSWLLLSNVCVFYGCGYFFSSIF